LPEIATVPDGLAASVPVKAEPSDIGTETAATTVPSAALSGRDAVLGANVTPVGVVGGGGGGAAITLTLKVAEPLNCVLIPTARTRTG
jgi:hypothetical protein